MRGKGNVWGRTGKRSRKKRPAFYPPLFSPLFFLRSTRPGFCFTSTSSANMNVRDFPCQSATFTYSALGASTALITGGLGFPISGIFSTSSHLAINQSIIHARSERSPLHPKIMTFMKKKEGRRRGREWKASRIWRRLPENREERPTLPFISFPPNLVPELLSLYSPGRSRKRVSAKMPSRGPKPRGGRWHCRDTPT